MGKSVTNGDRVYGWAPTHQVHGPSAFTISALLPRGFGERTFGKLRKVSDARDRWVTHPARRLMPCSAFQSWRTDRPNFCLAGAKARGASWCVWLARVREPPKRERMRR